MSAAMMIANGNNPVLQLLYLVESWSRLLEGSRDNDDEDDDDDEKRRDTKMGLMAFILPMQR